MVLPSGMSFEDAAALPTAVHTAWSALMREARTKSGNVVLV